MKVLAALRVPDLERRGAVVTKFDISHLQIRQLLPAEWNEQGKLDQLLPTFR